MSHDEQYVRQYEWDDVGYGLLRTIDRSSRSSRDCGSYKICLFSIAEDYVDIGETRAGGTPSRPTSVILYARFRIKDDPSPDVIDVCFGSSADLKRTTRSRRLRVTSRPKANNVTVPAKSRELPCSRAGHPIEAEHQTDVRYFPKSGEVAADGSRLWVGNGPQA
jgi:hypothetical protein